MVVYDVQCLLFVSGELTSLDLSFNSLGGYYTEEPDGYDSDGDEQTVTEFHSEPSGIMALADALRVKGELTALDVRGNYLDKKATAALKKAVKKRKGFALQM